MPDEGEKKDLFSFKQQLLRKILSQITSAGMMIQKIMTLMIVAVAMGGGSNQDNTMENLMKESI